MIPVADSVITKVDLTVHKNDSTEVRNSKTLMQKQLAWCRNHVDVITNRAQKVYNLVVNFPDKNKYLTKRSSKLKELEKELDRYLKRL